MKDIFNRFQKKIFLGLFLVGSGVFYLKVLSPTLGISIPCIFRKITGFYCPGCGMTRASLALLDGDIYQSFRYNMLIYILIPLLVLFYILDKKGNKKYSQIIMTSMLILTFLFGILRNLDGFSWLAPVLI
ncbi:MAG: DUF2752 domain-containing protein [Amphibacillus sp.]|nr:DUF2752 domain-containing protein [Amphibacillus sp.]